MANYHIEIEGMGCPRCVKSVTEGLTELGAEVRACEIGSADISFDGDMEKVKEVISDRGFDVKEITEN